MLKGNFFMFPAISLDFRLMCHATQALFQPATSRHKKYFVDKKSKTNKSASEIWNNQISNREKLNFGIFRNNPINEILFIAFNRTKISGKFVFRAFRTRSNSFTSLQSPVMNLWNLIYSYHFPSRNAEHRKWIFPSFTFFIIWTNSACSLSSIQHRDSMKYLSRLKVHLCSHFPSSRHDKLSSRARKLNFSPRRTRQSFSKIQLFSWFYLFMWKSSRYSHFCEHKFLRQVQRLEKLNQVGGKLCSRCLGKPTIEWTTVKCFLFYFVFTRGKVLIQLDRLSREQKSNWTLEQFLVNWNNEFSSLCRLLVVVVSSFRSLRTRIFTLRESESACSRLKSLIRNSFIELEGCFVLCRRDIFIRQRQDEELNGIACGVESPPIHSHSWLSKIYVFWVCIKK